MHDQLHPPFSERSEILNSVRISNFAWLPPAVHSNCSERLWLHARTLLVALENRVGWLGDQIKDVHFLFSLFLPTPPLWPQKREYNAVSTIADEIWQHRTGRNLTMFDKDHDTTEEGLIASPPEVKFLQPSIRLRYNYYVQLVATRRNWMRVPNLKFQSAR